MKYLALSILLVSNITFANSYRSNEVPSMEFVKLPGGTFTMGSGTPAGEQSAPTDFFNSVYNYRDEKPHTVTVSGFYIQTTEVTQLQYHKVTGQNPSYHNERYDCPNEFAYEMCPDFPVEKVSWNDTQRFIEKLNEIDGEFEYRLPTEAEWEYAARAGSVLIFPEVEQNHTNWWATALSMKSYAWFNVGSPEVYQTNKVATKNPSKFGLYDMMGNVSEWVQDSSGEYQLDQTLNPQGPSTGEAKVLRGGSFMSLHYPDVRPAVRIYSDKTQKGKWIGFRLVRLPKHLNL
jgi:sulfatase modifying factor 1